MIRIVIAENGKKVLNRLNLNIDDNVIQGITECIPKIDLIGLDYILLTDVPSTAEKHLKGYRGAYYPKYTGQASPSYARKMPICSNWSATST
jgi:hypothetical protein